MKCFNGFVFLLISSAFGELIQTNVLHGTKNMYILNNSVEYLLTYSNNQKNIPYRVKVWSLNCTDHFPIMIVVRQEKQIISWQIPFLIETYRGIMEYSETSKTLCYYDTVNNLESYKNYTNYKYNYKSHNFTVLLSTFSTQNVTVWIQTEVVTNYNIEHGKKYNATFSPSEPVFYSYDFPIEKNLSKVETVLINVTSTDDVCFVISLQPKTCPVMDLNDGIKFKGKYQTINTNGALAISKTQFPNGFLLVFVSKGDNHECNQVSSLLTNADIVIINQTTKVTFEVNIGKSEDEYLIAIFIVLGINIIACLFFAIISSIFYYFGQFKNFEEFDTISISNSSDNESETFIEMLELKVGDFVKRGSINNKKALNYVWHVANIALFYGIPVVQFMISYQKAVNLSGNLDLCYHNFHCLHPYYFTAFNHIYSNIGYILFGILFLAITLFRSFKIKNIENCGIQKFHGLYYSMGLALVFEGVFSACYHICPNQANFQFDTSFMYVMVVLILVKLYQNRHPDINASAYGTFAVLGMCVIIAMFGILFNNTGVMVTFILFYIIFCLYISLKMYYFGYIMIGLNNIYTFYKLGNTISTVLKPMRKNYFITLTIVNICNTVVVILGIKFYPSKIDFGSFLLGILLINAIIYVIYYITMKIYFKETVCMEAKLYGVLGLFTWILAVYHYQHPVAKWSLTPAESHQLNQKCIFLDFYDTHDVWHLLSAPALFFSFMFLYSLDDDLFDRPHDEINSF